MSTPSKAHRAILLLGMHRSGTSATTRVLNLLGADLGADLLPAADDNARGFWEHRGVVAIHEQLLGALNRSWQDIRAMPDNWLSCEAASIARKELVDLLSEEFANSPLWAVKDPRLCRLLPLWHLVLDDMNVEANVVFIVRHPTEVAQSLAARDGMSGGLARLLWLEHMLEGELASRQLPRAVIVYDNLLQDWEGCMRQLQNELQMHWPVAIESVRSEVGSFLSISERHHSEHNAGEVELPDLVRSVHDSFLEKANGYPSWDKIEKVSDIYQLNAKVFLDGIEEIVRQITALQVMDTDKGKQIALLERRLSDFPMALSESHIRKSMQGAIAIGGKFEDVAKIYWKSPDGTYAEEYCSEFRHTGLFNATHLKFEFSTQSKLNYIRFDPSEVAGEFILQDMRINGANYDFPESEISAVHQFIVANETDELRFESIENDPFVEFNVSSFNVQPGELLVVELTCQRSTLYGEWRQSVEKMLEAVFLGAGASEAAKLHQATLARIEALEARLEHVAVSAQGERAKLILEMGRHTENQNGVADRHAAGIASKQQEFRNERLSQETVLQERLEAIETRLAHVAVSAQTERMRLLRQMDAHTETKKGVADRHAAEIVAQQQGIRDELLRQEMVLQDRLKALEARFAQVAADDQRERAGLLREMVEHSENQNGVAERYASMAMAQQLVIKEELLSQQKEVANQLEALEARLAHGEASARSTQAQLMERVEQYVSKQSGISEHLVCVAETEQQTLLKHAEVLSGLRQQMSDMTARQGITEELLGGIQPQLESLAALCELAVRQSQEINSKQAVSQESLESLRTQLGALSDFQQRSFIGRIRYRFSKTRGSSA